MNDTDYMQIALRLARRGLGCTAPNPSVGCIIVKDQQIIGEGITGEGGVPHAETLALVMAGSEARGSTAYITLEPCCHYGKTPPCTNALIEAGISRVVIGTQDPDNRVHGKGIAQLQAASITVECGICENDAIAVNSGFFSVIKQQRPMVTLKLATSLDGKIATASGESQWITSESARNYGHLLRAQHDAIMVGVETIRHDNPSLTCRLLGMENRSPIRIVMDSHLRIPRDAIVVNSSATTPTWIITTTNKTIDGVKSLTVAPDKNGRCDIDQAIKLLATQNITRLLVEGGGTLAASLLNAGLIDQLVWIHAPKIIGNDGIAAISNLGLEHLADISSFTQRKVQSCGNDIIEHYYR